ncbi:MAG: thiolase family protein [Gemmataceae bacterium]|nr:thiolase family protein [Gemmataceae bacterium]
MGEAWIVEAVRSPVARADPQKGAFRHVRPDDLAGNVLASLVARAKANPALIEDVLLGCVRQQGEQGFNIARQAVLLAGFPQEVCGVTVNRNCGSSLEALHQAARAIRAGEADLLIAGGVEHLDRAGWEVRPDLSPAMLQRFPADSFHMGLICEFLGREKGISRAEQDEFAQRSHEKAAAATKAGLFQDEIIPILGHAPEGASTRISQDQTIRLGSTLAALADLKPAFLPEGTITAGNASPLSVGAAAILLASEKKCQELGVKPVARVTAMAVTGIDPLHMGLGPVSAMQKVVQKAGLTMEQVEIIEINEAFAVQTLAVVKELSLPMEKVNQWGGAIALGHPLGATGARMTTTAVHAMKRTGARFALLAMCIGGGQGMATLLEKA